MRRGFGSFSEFDLTVNFLDSDVEFMMNSRPTLTWRQKIFTPVMIGLFAPIAIPIMIFTPTPGPEWLFVYGDFLENLLFGEKCRRNST